MSVDIEVTPPDFGLSPPYYRPASSLTLSCIATGASDSVAYRWRSTHSQSFINRATASVRTKDFLTAYDSGTHTCTITDTDGTAVSKSVKILLNGKPVNVLNYFIQIKMFTGVGLCVSASYSTYCQRIANNTALSWRYKQYYEVYIRCYSNTTSDIATIVLPNGLEYSSYNGGTYTISRRSPAGINLYTRYSTPTTGIYTCRMTSPSGQVRDVSFGIFTTTIREYYNIVPCMVQIHIFLCRYTHLVLSGV